MKPSSGLVCVICLSACGGFTDPGSGSGTLEVEAVGEYDIDEDQTDFRVSVRTPSGSLDSALVFLTDDDTSETRRLERTGENNDRAFFETSFSGYARRVAIDIQRDEDSLSAQLEGPGRHVITNPVNGDALRIDDAFDIKWRVEDGLEADQVKVSLDEAEYNVTLLSDDGNFQVASDVLRAGDESVEVERTNVLLLAGGESGSVFRLIYRVENDFVAGP